MMAFMVTFAMIAFPLLLIIFLLGGRTPRAVILSVFGLAAVIAGLTTTYIPHG